MTTGKKYWSGNPTHCDICSDALEDEVYDVRIPRAGSWALVCPACFRREACKLGTGHGQHYHRTPDNRWEKING